MTNFEYIAPNIIDSKTIKTKETTITGIKYNNKRQLIKYDKDEFGYTSIKDIKGRFDSFENGIKKMESSDKNLFKGI